MGKIMKNSVEYGTTTTINDVTVNGTSVVTSGVAEVDLSADNTTFDNMGTGMTATDVQDAITELNSGLTNKSKVSIIGVEIIGTTNQQGYIATGYDYNDYLVGCRFKVTGSGGVYAILRPSASDKVVIHFMDDNLSPLPNTSMTGKLFYLSIV